MATFYALSRSFYAWITKLKLADPGLASKLPEAYATSLPAMQKLVEELRPQLVKAEQQKRLDYWQEILKKFEGV